MKFLTLFFLLWMTWTVPVFPAGNDSDNTRKSNFDILNELSDLSLTPEERLKNIKNLQKTNDMTIHQKLMEIALFDENVNIRTSVEQALKNILDLDEKQKKVLSEFLEPGAIFAYKRIRLLNNLSPLTYFYIYFLIKSAPLNTKINKLIFSTIKEITEAHQIFQNIMLKLLTSGVEDISKKAQSVLLDSNLSLESQRQLLKMSLSDNFSAVSHVMAQNILKHQILHLEIQKVLVNMVHDTTDKSFSRIFTKTTPEYILTGVPAMDPEMQINLVKIATSEYSSDFARNTSSNIIINAYSSQESAYKELIRLATSNESSEVKKNSKNILLQLSPIKEQLQQELLRIATSHSESLEAKKQATDILIHTRYLYPKIQKSMSIFFRCRRAFTF